MQNQLFKDSIELVHGKPGTHIHLFRDTIALVHAKSGTRIQLFTDTIVLVHAKPGACIVIYRYNRTGTCKIRYTIATGIRKDILLFSYLCIQCSWS